MEVFRFGYKREKLINSNLILALVFPTACGFLMLFRYRSIAVDLIFTITLILSLIITRPIVKKLRKTFREIRIDDNNLKFYPNDMRKNALAFKKEEITIVITEKELIINNKETGSLIGYVSKRTIEEPDKWEHLIELLK